MKTGACVRAFTLAAVLWWGGAASLHGDAEPREVLPTRYQEWLTEVALLITREERREFQKLSEDYQRDGFIDAFWEARGRSLGVPGNVAARWHQQRLEEAVERFGATHYDQAVVYTLHGEPHDRLQTDCGMLLWPLDIWVYPSRAEIRREILVLFYQPAASGPYRMWHPSQGFEVLSSGPGRADAPLISLIDDDGNRDIVDLYCIALPPVVDKLRLMLRWLAYYGDMGVREAQRPPLVDTEWLQTFRALSTDLPRGAPTFTPSLSFSFPGRSGARVVVHGTLELPATEGVADPRAIGRAYQLFGEVLHEGRLHETFRYRFELPPAVPGEPSALVFERLLRPGDYTVVLRLGDGLLGSHARLRENLSVPDLEELAEQWLEAEAPDRASQVLRLVPPGPGPHTGGLRIEAQVAPIVERVAFLVDDQPLVTRSRPPFSIELALGRTPRTRTVRALAFDATGDEVAVDELVLNPAPHAFDLRLVEPRGPVTPGASLPLRVDTVIPQGRRLEQVELFVEDRRVATLFQPPWYYETRVPPGPVPSYVRAVGVLDDGSTTEAALALHGETPAGRVDVHLVEVYTTVLDARGGPIEDLAPEEVEVYEDGETQTLLRFQRVSDLPLHVLLLVDTSASMGPSLAAAQAAAQRFFEATLKPGDRGAVMTFSEVPRLVAPFMPDPEELAFSLVGLTTETGTALWDSLIHALHYFQGLQGQRALLLLSDGEDHNSRRRFEDALEYARHAGVTIYTVHFGGALRRRMAAGRQLTRLAAETGGRGFSGDDPESLAAIYRQIEEDLRSRYLLVYQSPGGADDRFRRVEVRVLRPGHRARHMAGYLP